MEMQVRSQRIHTSRSRNGRASHISSSAVTGRLVDMHVVHLGYSIQCIVAENAYFFAQEDEEVYCWLPKEWVNMCYARGGRVENLWWKLKRQLYGRRKAA